MHKTKIQMSKFRNGVPNDYWVASGQNNYALETNSLVFTKDAGKMNHHEVCIWNRVILRQFVTKRAHDAIITPLLRQNDVATSFWRNDDLAIASCAYWVSARARAHDSPSLLRPWL